MKTLVLLLIGMFSGPEEKLDKWDIREALEKFHEPGYPGNFRHDETTLFMYTEHGVVFIDKRGYHDVQWTVYWLEKGIEALERSNARLDRMNRDLDRELRLWERISRTGNYN